MRCGWRTLPSLLPLCVIALLAACAPELERFEQRRSPRGTLGEEVYKVVCRRMAGTAYPEDITGKRSAALCLGDAKVVRDALAHEPHEPRLAALAARRSLIAGAVDDTFRGALSDPLEQLLHGLLPYYDAPEERVQAATRALASVLERIAGKAGEPPGRADAEALDGLVRLLEEGHGDLDTSFGALRALVGTPFFGAVAGTLLPHTDDPAVRPAFDALLSALGLTLATDEPDPDDEADLADLKRLLWSTHPDFASGKPLHALVRDARGHFVPTPSDAAPVPFPFVDSDGDGLADASDGALTSTLDRPLPAPYPAVGEPPTSRDPLGRALAFMPDGAVDSSRLLYRTTDLDATLLGGLLRVARGLFRDDGLTRGLASGLSPILGDSAPAKARFGAFDLTFPAPEPSTSPLLELVHAATALIDQPVVDDALALSERLLVEHEGVLADSLTPLLALERRTRGDAYPNARLKPGHTFWDELLFELEKLSRRRASAGASGETLLEALTRASLGYGRNLTKLGAPIERISDPQQLRRQGALFATLMRFKDDWRANPVGASKRAPDEPGVIGGFRTPVDRSAPDTPVRCGRDGCGGLIAGTPFERWAKPGQQCVVQRSGRPVTGRDCGAAANQSLFQRTLGMIGEMAGRTQCNKPLTVAELLEQAIEDPCAELDKDSAECDTRRRQQQVERQANVRQAEEAVRSYACPANAPFFAPCRLYRDRFPSAFVDPDGAGGEPSSIAACHLIDLPDVGRAFGKVVTGEFTIDIPNPWVRRYLEDIARAGDGNGDGTADLPLCTANGFWFNFPIIDPNIPPNCTPEAAKLGRDLYKDMPRSITTLSGLIEYMLDDTQLFVSDEDARRLRPDPKALSRVLFAASEGTTVPLFDPPLVRGAPKSCKEAPKLPVCAADDSQPLPAGGCCIEDPAYPPLRFRLDTYYGATSFAWEHPMRLRDGTTLSFLDSMKAASDAVARFDFVAGRDDPRNFEDTGYVFSSIGRLVAEHYDTAENSVAQDRDPAGMHFRRLTGLASYEGLLADALDDGTIDLAQPGPDGAPLFEPGSTVDPEQALGLLDRATSMLTTLDALDFGGGRDGIDVSMELAEQMLNGHARCAGATGDRRVIAGQGACDRALRGEAGFGPPLTYRDGRSHVCYHDGRCFAGGDGVPRRFTSPARQLYDALDAMLSREDADPTRAGALHGVLGGVADAFLQTSPGQFADRRAVRLMRVAFDEAKQKLAEERGAGTLSTVRARTVEDVAELLRDPVVASALGVISGLHGQREAMGAVSSFASALLGGDDEAHLRPLLVGLFDALQMLPADATTRALMRAAAEAFLPGAERRARDGGSTALAPQTGAVARNLFVLRETARGDRERVLDRVLHNLTSAPRAGEQAPFVRILDALLETNRVVPGAEGSPNAADVRALLHRLTDVMRDEQHGFERIYETVRCTRQPRADGCTP